MLAMFAADHANGMSTMSLTMQLRRSPQLASFALKTLSAAVLAATLMASASGAGLGRLTVLSSLGQPLNAEIELTSVSRDEAGNLTAKLASAEAFRQANIEFNPALYAIRFALEQRGGRQVIRVTSAQPMNEPFVDMLLELGGTNGRLVREYTFLLDPADMRSAQAAAPIASTAPAPVKAPRGIVEPAPAAPKAAPERADADPAPVRKSGKLKADGSDTADGAVKSYTVKRGDSLARIANQVRSNGVSLDQMLVAIYRANPSAFVGENMNRMRSGQILAIPGADTASGISTTEARGVVVAQAQDFSAYRNKLAGQIATSTPQKAPESGQTAGGSITAKVEEPKNAANESRDKLKLSKAGVPTAANAPAKTATGPSVEEQIAKDKAISEANARVRDLEKNVADLQKILELKNKNLAEQQKKAETTAKPALALEGIKPADKAAGPAESTSAATVVPNAKVSTAGQETVTSATTANTAVATPPTTASATATALPPAVSPVPQVPVAVVKAPKPTAVAPSSVESSFMDDLMGNAFVLPALGLILVALGALGIVSSRRKKKNQQFEDSILTDSNLKANSLFGSTGGQSVDTNNSVFNSSFAPMASQLDANEVDPVAEADVYIAYGRDAQAEEILKEALRTQPDRHAVRTKLLEIYATRKDTRSFDMMASELYSMTKGEGADWEHAASMGAALDPNNPLYAGAKSSAVAASAAAFGASSVAADSFDLESLLATTQHHDVPASIDTIAPSLDHALHLPVEAEVPSLPGVHDQHIEHNEHNEHNAHDLVDTNEMLAASHTLDETPAPQAHHPAASLDNSLDFDLAGLTLPEDAPAAIAHPVHEDNNHDVNSLNFDMPASIDETASAMESKHSHQVVDTEHHDRLATPAAEHKPHTDSGAGLDTGLDFMLQHAEPAHTNTVTEHVPVSPPVVAAPDPLEFDLSGISLDLAPTGAHSAPVAHPASYPVPDHTAGVEQESHDTLVLDDDLMSSAPEMATKLDIEFYQDGRDALLKALAD